MNQIDEFIKIHDNYQFERKFTFPFAGNKRRTVCDVETYLFAPVNLGINRHTYTRHDFYSNQQTYIRLKTPAILLQDITSGDNGPFQSLKRSLAAVLAYPHEEHAVDDFIYTVKMFCSVFKSACRDAEFFIETLDKSKDIEYWADDFMKHSSGIVDAFRSLRNEVHVPTVDEKAYKLYLFADEYLSLTLNKHRYRLHFFLDRRSTKNVDQYRGQLLSALQDEINYRKKNSYPSIPSDQSDNEAFVYRFGLLKKLLSSALFLKTHTEPAGKFLEQASFALAAGLAMALATSAVFMSQRRFGNFTMPLFLAVVVAYIFKDRLKELCRFYLSIAIRRRLYDHKTYIYSSTSDSKIGIQKESFCFVSDRNLPSDVEKLRNRDYFAEVDNSFMGEKIILHKRRVSLLSKKCENLVPGFDIQGINDIVRLNVRPFLTKADNPEKRLYMPGKSGLIEIRGSRVYHLNMIVKYRMADDAEILRRFRIVLDRKGIKRLHEVTVGGGEKE